MTRVFDKELSAGELMAGVLRGDADCADAFHRRYGARISKMVWYILGADRDHEDVMQLVFVQILDSLSSVTEPSRLDQWVDSVTFRTVRKELRGRRYRRQVVFSTDAASEVVDLRNPSAPLVARRFYRVLDSLPAEDRMVFVLKYMEGHSLMEMAAISGWSVATVKRRLNRALETFRKQASEDMILSVYTGDTHHVGS